MNNKWLWLAAGVILGAYVLPALRARTGAR
jgi:hypothetical protein